MMRQLANARNDDTTTTSDNNNKGNVADAAASRSSSSLSLMSTVEQDPKVNNTATVSSVLLFNECYMLCYVMLCCYVMIANSC
jgi:hypothetical protein